MPDFDSGISRYIHARAVVDVFFPVDAKGNEYCCCEQCYLYSSSSRKCKLTNDVCSFPSKYVSGACPLQRIEVEKIEEFPFT